MKVSDQMSRLLWGVGVCLGLSTTACRSQSDAPLNLSHGTTPVGKPDSEGLGGGGGAEPGAMIGDRVSASGADLCEGLLCAVGEICVVEDGFSRCDCAPGYGGPDCLDEDECEQADRCPQGAVCRNLPGAFVCDCGLGQSFEDGHCVVRPECELGVSGCAPDATCHEVEGGSVCACPSGSFGNGVSCGSEDACLGDPCGAGECLNSGSGSFSCLCPLGSTGHICQQKCPLDEALVFESVALEQAVRGVVGGAGPITPRELEGFYELRLSPADHEPSTDDEVLSLAGLECWSTLRVLDLEGHRVKDVEALSVLTALEQLNLRCAEPASFDALAGLHGLKSLSLGESPLCPEVARRRGDPLFLAELTALEELYLGGFTVFESANLLKGLTRLRRLDLRKNGLSNLVALESLRRLEELWLSENPIEKWPNLGQLGLLKRAFLRRTESDTLPGWGESSSLLELDVSENQLGSLVELKGLDQLQVLRAANNRITEVNGLSALEELHHLELQSNLIEELGALVGNEAFSDAKLWLGDNPLACGQVRDQLTALRRRQVTVYGACQEPGF